MKYVFAAAFLCFALSLSAGCASLDAYGRSSSGGPGSSSAAPLDPNATNIGVLVFTNTGGTNFSYLSLLSLTNDLLVSNIITSNRHEECVVTTITDASTNGFLMYSTTNTNIYLVPFSVVSTNIFVIGSSWKRALLSAPFAPRYGHQAVVWNNRIYVIGGYTNGANRSSEVWSTADGTNWIQDVALAIFSQRQDFQAFVYNGSLWLQGGYSGVATFSDLYYSTNGTNWTSVIGANPGVKQEHLAYVYGDNVYLVNGSYNGGSFYNSNVTYSLYGTNWLIATNGTPFFRCTAAGAVFNNHMFLVGGYSLGYSSTNDVWWSDDGAHWQCATANASFGRRSAHAMAVYRGRMWIIGGGFVTNSGLYNDVWMSQDGTNWAVVTGSAAFSARSKHQVVVFKNRLWLIGGYDGFFRNDVWYTE